MTDFSETPQSEKIFDVIQIVALNCALSTGLIVVVRTAGASWGVTLLAGWFGGALLTLALVFCVYILKTGFSRNTSAARQARDENELGHAAPLVPMDIRDPVQAWEVDRLLEIDRMLSQKRLEPQNHMARRSQQDMIRIWDEDAAEDSCGSNQSAKSA